MKIQGITSTRLASRILGYIPRSRFTHISGIPHKFSSKFPFQRIIFRSSTSNLETTRRCRHWFFLIPTIVYPSLAHRLFFSVWKISIFPELFSDKGLVSSSSRAMFIAVRLLFRIIQWVQFFFFVSELGGSNKKVFDNTLLFYCIDEWNFEHATRGCGKCGCWFGGFFFIRMIEKKYKSGFQFVS